MIEYIKGRQLDPSKPVKVYWNLHKKLYSVQQGGLVIGHTRFLRLTDATFQVNEAGRQRVLREQKKNVHAFVIGYFVDDVYVRQYDGQVTYNPYKYDSFMFLGNRGPQPIRSAKRVQLTNTTLAGGKRVPTMMICF